MKTILKCSLFFALIIGSFNAVAQSKQFYKVISFDEKIDFGNVDASAKWTINNMGAKVFASLNGKQINDYVFQQTGEYEIQFLETKKHNEECSHPMFPDKITVKVNPVKLTFNFSKIEFSEKIERGRNYENLIITVPVTITSKNNSISKLPAPGLSIAGIGVELKAEPMNNDVEVRNGDQVLKYKVSGMVKEQSYLMFDFSDFNGGVQTYNLPQIIN
ncbi:hypothetical protein NAT51_17415 [Flavobacterium amniphilum]|uniref:hypothetical protein n=1 Tax=Flavobacterium amniphilum TaxID=1834035 RepID=UPI00202A7366|nr:hypothetical protein [Flavobacterium amniphilum]MCL9807314.1 hypothetical protein [Flavobacterium amniphilum]